MHVCSTYHFLYVLIGIDPMYIDIWMIFSEYTKDFIGKPLSNCRNLLKI